ncbi:MAG: T9SS type A sorting domain-containing protein [candidate division KSB1 bacterium]|nr:T9SS type A sorting domain-containing protein [candidate division KSB1 bacterium]
MKTWRKAAVAAAVAVLVGVSLAVAQTPVSQWGFIGNKGPTRTAGWRFVPGAVPGDAGVAGDQALAANQWAAIRGGFDDTVRATVDEAIRVTGKIEFVGGDPKWWSALRWGLFYHDSAGVLVNVDTDSAYWTGYEKYAYGYLFVPHNGVVDRPTWAVGGGGDVGVARGGAWLSTYGVSHLSMGFVDQRPRRAEMTEGVYRWAVSVRPLDEKRNEVRFYLVKEDNSYWWAGVRIDTTRITTVFNGVCFAINGGQGGSESSVRGMYVREVYVDRGAPIEIPEAPFVPFYVGQWGFIGNKGPTRTAGWKFIPGEYTGDAGVGGDTAPVGGQWAAIRGGFEEEVTATSEKAIRVTGKLEFVGADPKWWGALRFGLFYHDSAGVLVNVDTDSAYWTGYEKYAYGYLFHPKSGVLESPNWAAGGGGDLGVARGGAWLSTYGVSHLSMGFVPQAPPRAEMTAGVYNWGISVRPLDGKRNEVRFYLVKEDNSYWWAGVRIDTTQITTKFNGVCFATIGPGSGYEGYRGMYVREVYVDRGDPIQIPPKPFSPFYVGEWGFLGGRTGGWKITLGEYEGNVSIGGTGGPAGWSAIRGAFKDAVTLSADKALLITGRMELVGGGFEAPNSLRMGVFYTDSAGVLLYPESDSARWSGVEGHHTGYLFIPRSGWNDPALWTGGVPGTVGAVVDWAWLDPQGPANRALTARGQFRGGAHASAGTYDFKISIQKTSDAKTEIRYWIFKEGYHFAGIVIDNQPPTDVFNSINFALGNTNANRLNLVDVYVDMGSPIEIPDSILTAVSINVADKVVPTSYVLGQNYPNPFNPTTTIVFGLPKDSEVTLEVFDALGRCVAVLAKGRFQAGFHTVTFDAKDLPSGVYLYRLQAGDFTSVKKLMLTK